MPTAIRPQNVGTSTPTNTENNPPDGDHLRPFSRSPHPYHRQQSEIHSHTEHSRRVTETGSEWSNSLAISGSSRTNPEREDGQQNVASPRRWQDSSKSPSDSGTEADDEGNGLLKGLPAPPHRARKGLRDERRWIVVATPSPLLTPSHLEVDRQTLSLDNGSERRSSAHARLSADEEAKKAKERFLQRRRAELVRRISEALLLGVIGCIVYRGIGASEAASGWRNGGVHPFQLLRRELLADILSELISHLCVLLCLYSLYPLRLLMSSHASAAQSSKSPSRLRIPSSFDPAPLLYPIFLPVYVTIVLSAADRSVLLPNLVLSLSSIPPAVIPLVNRTQSYSVIHWMITVTPLLFAKDMFVDMGNDPQGPFSRNARTLKSLDPGLLFLYPLHRALLVTLQYLTTTSLLPTELQLLSISLINLLLHSTSPQGIILQSLLWLGGLAMLISCRHVLGWAVSLARIPSWRFRRKTHSTPIRNTILEALNNSFGKRLGAVGSGGQKLLESDSDSGENGLVARGSRRMTGGLVSDSHELRRTESENIDASTIDDTKKSQPARSVSGAAMQNQQHSQKRRHTLSTFGGPLSSPRLPSLASRRQHKRSASSSVNSFLSLTSSQAAMRKWIYAMYIYAAMVLIIAVGIRPYVRRKALSDNEPVGWALGYLLGDLQSFRQWVVSWNLGHWIPLPQGLQANPLQACHLGWVEHIRQDTLGAANARLLICAYCLLVITVGLAIVFRLSSVVEVDTRRKVFHGMMVAMFLPATFVDPAFASLALALILAIFLLLDLFRASQLPPLSKPLTHFLAPYVDGRDHRGPVVVSHIFLLIGCAIPLWLSLAGIARTGQAPWKGWEVSTREVSMVSGVVCVGMGDAAASLIGRRFGRRRWLWSGGKSLEGSFAFAAAVTLGLVLAKAWLRIGGWPGDNSDGWFVTLVKSVIVATGASLTEAILTGGNDNVVVPVVLWLLTKGLSI